MTDARHSERAASEAIASQIVRSEALPNGNPIEQTTRVFPANAPISASTASAIRSNFAGGDVVGAAQAP